MKIEEDAPRYVHVWAEIPVENPPESLALELWESLDGENWSVAGTTTWARSFASGNPGAYYSSRGFIGKHVELRINPADLSGLGRFEVIGEITE